MYRAWIGGQADGFTLTPSLWLAASLRPLRLSLLEHHIPSLAAGDAAEATWAAARDRAAPGASHAQRDLLELTLPAEHWRARVAR